MYSVSNAYKTAIREINPDSYVLGTITLLDSTIITITDADINSLDYINQCTPDDGFSVGYTHTGEQGITIYDDISNYRAFQGAKIELIYYLKISPTEYEGVPLGIFEVVEATRPTATTIKLVGYDNMTKFDVDYPLAVSERYSMRTPFQRVKDLCVALGVELWEADVNAQFELSDMPNGTISHSLAFTHIVTARDYLDYLCQLLCGFATIDRLGRLRIVCWKLKGTITGYAIPDNLRKSSTFNDTVLKYSAVNMSVSFYEGADGGSVKNVIAPETPTGTGEVLSMYTNNLIRGFLYDQAQTILDNIASVMTNTDPENGTVMRWLPCDIQYTGDPALDLGDWVTYTGYTAGEGIEVPIHKIDWKYRGWQRLETLGENKKSERENNANRIKQAEQAAIIVALTDDVAEKWEYDFVNSGKEVRILGYLGNNTKVTIPSDIEGKSVTTIGSGEFSVPLTGIGKILELVIPNSVHTISNYAFYSQYGAEKILKRVIIGNGVQTIGSNAFRNCYLLEYISIGDGVKEIGQSVFQQAGRNSVSNDFVVMFGKNVEKIGDWAFSECYHLRNLILPNKLKEIGICAFEACNQILEVTIPDGVEIIKDSAFSGCSEARKLTLNNTITSINRAVFRSWWNLDEVYIPPQVTTIGKLAFEHNGPETVYMSETCTYQSDSFAYGVNIIRYTGDIYDNKPLFFNEFAEFPVVGNEYHLYIAKDTNEIYRWDSVDYVAVSGSSAGNTYSTTETKTNQTWLDGKSIYRKLFEIPNASLTAGLTQIALDVDAETITNLHATIEYTASTSLINVNSYWCSDLIPIATSQIIKIECVNGNLEIHKQNDMSVDYKNLTITIEFTKTS